MKVLISTIATGKYYELFSHNLFCSLIKHAKFNFDFLCFTENNSKSEFEKIFIPHLPFPLNTLLRYEIFSENERKILKYDYFFYLDADMIAIGDIEKDIISDSVHVLHPGFYGKNRSCYSYERNEKSTAFMKDSEGEKYYQGCFQGGRSDCFIKMSNNLKNNIREDLKNNIIAEWWDESHMNKYRYSNAPTKILNPDYAYPSEWLEKTDNTHVNKSDIEINYISENPKILHIKKDHKNIRI